MPARRFILLAVLFSILVLGPYSLASQFHPGEAVFQGFLINPIDGNSYLAKMYQGWRGSWQFRLPYTTEPGEGAYLFLYYIFLGHLARWTGLSLILVYHLARWLGSIFMLWSLMRFYTSLGFKGNLLAAALVLSAVGAGMGWLVFFSGNFTADFWVAEAYPFLSAYTNPHFPLALGLILCLLSGFSGQSFQKRSSWNLTLLGLAVATLLLAIISPFGVVIVLVVSGVRLVWRLLVEMLKYPGRIKPRLQPLRIFFAGEHKIDLQIFSLVLAFGLPVLVYDWLIAKAHPVLAIWNAQNLTPSPPVWDVLLSFSPVIVLALVGLFARRREFSETPDTLVSWLVISLFLMYLPWELQRRFMIGLYVPAAGLALIGLQNLAQRYQISFKFLYVVLLLFSIPSPLIVILAGQYGVQTQDASLFLSAGEAECLAWIEANTSPDALVLAAPDMSLFIPAVTGRRVLYGHPFETAQAEQERTMVKKLLQQSDEFEQAETARIYLQQRGVDYLFWGERESILGPFPDWPGLTKVCSSDEANLYKLQAE